MDPLTQNYFFLHDSSQSLPPMRNPPPGSLFSSSSSHPPHTHTGFPIIAVAIIGILATGFLLVSYYVFVIKCCLNWHRIDLLRRFSSSGRRRAEDPLMDHSPAAENRGLDEATIRSIPIFPYRKWLTRKGELEVGGKNYACECAVCLNEFQEEEKLRVIPNCAHLFHIDCIDVWLQNNTNCPLCRRSISATRISHLDQIRAPNPISPSRGDPNRYGSDNFAGRDEDFVVIEISDQERNHSDHESLLRVQERLNNAGQEETQTVTGHINNVNNIIVSSSSPRKLEQRVSKKKEKLSHVSSMGDEFIDTRQKDKQFVIQPLRRSFSMDSAADPNLYLAVQEIIQQQQQQRQVNIHDGIISPSTEGCSSIGIKRSFFSFGHGRSSRNAVLPLHMEL